MQGDNFLGTVNWGDSVIRFTPLQEGRWSVLFSVNGWSSSIVYKFEWQHVSPILLSPWNLVTIQFVRMLHVESRTAVEKMLWLGRSKAAPSNSYPRQKCLKPYYTEVFVKGASLNKLMGWYCLCFCSSLWQHQDVGEGEYVFRSGLLPAKAALTSPGSILMSTVRFEQYRGLGPIKLQQFCPVMPLLMSDLYLHTLFPASLSAGWV